MTHVDTVSEIQDGASYAFPASFAQHRLWILDQLDPDRGTYNVPMQYDIVGTLDIVRLARSLSQLVERHEVLRTVFERSDSGDPLQVILPAQPVVVHTTERADATAADISEWCALEANAPFDLQNGPVIRVALLRTGSNTHVLSVTVHHIAFDGWSMSILQRELSELYNAGVAQREISLSEIPIQYADFTMWQRERAALPEFADSLRYWTEQLSAPLPVLELPTAQPQRASTQSNIGQVELRISDSTARALRQLAVRTGTTPFTVLLTAFQVLLHRHSGQEDVIIGTPISGRTSSDTENVVGCFVNTLAIRGNLAGKPDFQTMLNRTRGAMLSALAHDVPFEQIVAAVRPDRISGKNPLFQALFSLYETGEQLVLEGVKVASRTVALNTAKVDLQLLLQTTNSQISGTLEFDREVIDSRTALQLAQHFVTLVDSAVADPAVSIGELTMLSAAECSMLLHEWNRTTTRYRGDATVPQLFAERAASQPDAIAAVDHTAQLTYRELDTQANKLAARLTALGVGPDMIIGLCVERSLSMLVGALGIMKAGGAYLALDPTYPQARLSHMLSDSLPAVVVTEARVADRLPVYDGPRVMLDDAASKDSTFEMREPPVVIASNLAYVVYTSGSTGKPKGVAIEHRALVNLLQSMAHEPGFTSRDTLLAVTSLSFDIAALELWLPLITGGRVVIAPRSATVDGERLAELIDNEKVTVLQATPGTWRLLLAAGWSGRRELTMLCGGEALPPTLAAELLTKGRALWNMYGPAETTIWSTIARVTADAPITLGRPIANTVLRVLGEHGALQPVNVAGELYIGGDGLARGYINDPDRTSARFVTDPFAAEQRLYRTGDRVRWRFDGTLDFLGRLDDQVKIRGHRIELAEVEHGVATHEDVQSCAVVLRRREAGRADSDNEMQLVAYYVARPGASASPDTLRAHVRRLLPSAMTPDVFIALPVLPLGPTGKIDRRALLAVDVPGQRAPIQTARPRTTIEFDLVQIWQRLLNINPVGIRDDFFELGGHSLLAVQMLAEVERVRGRRLPLATLFDEATVEGIARRIESSVIADNEPALVVLQASGGERPFVFVHGDAGGGGWYCRRLAPLIGEDVPLIVLGTLDTTSPGSPGSIQDAAAIQLKALRAVQPNGPYRIGGFCIGGLVAFEIARQLRASGEVVERLILIDSSASPAAIPLIAPLAYSYVRFKYREEAQTERRTFALYEMRDFLGRIDKIRRLTLLQQFSWLRRAIVRTARRMTAPRVKQSVTNSVAAVAVSGVKPDSEYSTDAALVEYRLRPGTRASQTQGQWASVYAPRAYDGSIDVIASDAFHDLPNPETVYGWTRVCDARLHEIASSHFGLVTTELPALAQVIRSCLGEREKSALLK